MHSLIQNFCGFAAIFIFVLQSVSSFKIETNAIITRGPRATRELSRFYQVLKIYFPTRLQSTIKVRDWRDEDFSAIIHLLQSTESGCDPEGPFYLDCGSQSSIRDSYNSMDGGCFLVATDSDNSSAILGTAALISGTPITYFESGASVSSPKKVTGAVRRTCCIDAEVIDQDLVLESLLAEIEKRAAQTGVTELIALAYNSSSRLNPSLLDRLGYKKDSTNLGNIEALEYCKVLTCDNNDDEMTISTNKRSTTLNVEATFSILILGITLVSAIVVANIMGFELIPGNDNRGLGSPLTTQELQLLKEEEQLKRTDLDGQQAKKMRQWDDLSPEERREEAALLKIIQGQDVRLK